MVKTAGKIYSTGRYRAWAEIDLRIISGNVKKIKKQIGERSEFMAVVKADAYGHGAVEISKTVLEHGATWLGVATVQEGIELRDAGIDAPILVLAPIPKETICDAIYHGLRMTVYTREMLDCICQEANKQKKEAKIHVKVDTGMGRIGIEPEHALDFIAAAKECKGVSVEGLFTHFATADEEDKTFAKRQFDVFLKVKESLSQAGFKIPLYHAANSAAIIELPGVSFDMVRTGIALYGLYPSPYINRSIGLEPALQFKTRVIHKRCASKGTSISYGATYVAQEQCCILTLSVGYADGFSRALSNCGSVLIKGKRYPIVGRVCMDQCMVKAPFHNSINVEDEVVLIGAQDDESITADEVAGLVGTINYEVVCMITGRVPRVYIS